MAGELSITTLGHSARSIEDFVSLLRAHGIEAVVDVRRHPGSRRHPQFSRGALQAALEAAGLDYAHEPDLGGHRDPRPDSVHNALDEGLRGYADHMESETFRRAVTWLMERAAQAPTAVMCAEADWRHCHRSLLSDHLKLQGVSVVHAREATSPPEAHPWSARVERIDGRLVYRKPVQRSLLEGLDGT